jgi:hypothetical protein
VVMYMICITVVVNCLEKVSLEFITVLLWHGNGIQFACECSTDIHICSSQNMI